MWKNPTVQLWLVIFLGLLPVMVVGAVFGDAHPAFHISGAHQLLWIGFFGLRSARYEYRRCQDLPGDLGHGKALIVSGILGLSGLVLAGLLFVSSFRRLSEW